MSRRLSTPDPEFEALVREMLDETLATEGRRRLAERLSVDATARAYYFEQVGLHARLTLELQEIREPAEESPPSSRPRHLVHVLGVAAAIFTFAFILWFLVGGGEGPARLARSYAAVWEGPGIPVDGATLPAGQLHLREGAAEIVFSNGAVLVLEAPVKMEVLDAERIRLHEGRIAARVPPRAAGFTVETGRLKVVDLGARFGMFAEPSGGVRVQVFEGAVETHPASPLRGGRRLEAGQAARLRSDGDSLIVDSFDERRFALELPPPGEHYAPSAPSRHDQVLILPAPSDVRIDGDLSEWDRSVPLSGACIAPYGESYRFTGHMMFDRDRLYVAAVVADPYPMRNAIDPDSDFPGVWRGGSVQVRLSTDRSLTWPLDAAAPPRNDPVLAARDISDRIAHLTFWYSAGDRRARMHVEYGMDFHDPTLDPRGVQGTFRLHEDGRGYTMEYAVPWTALKASEDPPRSGDELAASWMVHWADRQGRLKRGYVVECFTPGHEDVLIESYRQGRTWGRALFGAPK